MSALTSNLPVMFSLAAMFIWGISDFSGGIGARRANAFLFTAVVHLSGVVMMFSLAQISRAPFPPRASVLWALAAGSIGGVALAVFYRALASGTMGLTAPVAAVLGAGIPTLVTAFVEGFPGYRHLAGFIVAGIGVWLISRTEDASGSPRGLGMAVFAGIGFAMFYLCIRQTGSASALWIAGISRFASLTMTSLVVFLGKQTGRISPPVMAVAVFTGLLDVGGSALFVHAEQIGRLDTAVVLSSLYPAITVLLARVFLREHFSRGRTAGMLAALAAVPLVAG